MYVYWRLTVVSFKLKSDHHVSYENIKLWMKKKKYRQPEAENRTNFLPVLYNLLMYTEKIIFNFKILLLQDPKAMKAGILQADHERYLNRLRGFRIHWFLNLLPGLFWMWCILYFYHSVCPGLLAVTDEITGISVVEPPSLTFWLYCCQTLVK